MSHINKKIFKMNNILKNIKKYLPIVTVLISCFSCDEYLDIPLPTDSLFTDQVFKQDKTTAAALNGVYGELTTEYYLSKLGLETAFYTDEYTPLNSGSTYLTTYENNLTPINAPEFYSKMYPFLYRVNLIIEGVTNTDATLKNKDQYLGEAYFLRAFIFYNLANVYGDIPLPTTSEFAKNNTLSRTPKSDVYLQVVEDLKMAINLLPEFYKTSGGDDTFSKNRPNKLAAKALLAKTFLYTKEWKKASDLCTEVLSEVQNPDLIPLNQVFITDSDAMIWELTADITEGSFLNYVPELFIYITSWNNMLPPIDEFNFPYAAGYLSQNLVDSFDTDDQRLENWILEFTVSGTQYYEPFKYQSDVSGEESLAILRMADIYLTRAEALAQQDDFINAMADVNVVRTRAGLLNAMASSKETALDAVLNERRKEFFTELSSRFFDLKRLNKIDEVMNDQVLIKGGDASWATYKQNWPISVSETIANPNLKQTEGY